MAGCQIAGAGDVTQSASMTGQAIRVMLLLDSRAFLLNLVHLAGRFHRHSDSERVTAEKRQPYSQDDGKQFPESHVFSIIRVMISL